VVKKAGLNLEDALRTYVEHIVFQVKQGILLLKEEKGLLNTLRLLITGGGAHNLFLVKRLEEELMTAHVECIRPSENLIDYKEALVIALMGALRWREEVNVMHSVTGASKDSINGAVWSV
jgi:anhydro-N-acetylmuramic acid kinase